MTDKIKNLADLSVEERRFAEIFAVSMSDADDLDQFLAANPHLADAEGLESMVRLGEFIESDAKSRAEASA